MFPQNQQKKKQNQYTNDSILESLRNLSTGVGDTLKNQSSQAANDAFSSLFGSFPQSQHEFNQQIPGEYTPERMQKNSFSRPEIVRPPVVKQEMHLTMHFLPQPLLEVLSHGFKFYTF